jgi:serine/threonine protein kinase
MAATYLALRRGPSGFEQHVCLKRILPNLEADPESVRLFTEEARIAVQLRHANIVQVLDFGLVGGTPYLALQWVDGVDLRALLRALKERGEKLDVPLVAHIGVQLAAALEAAHTPERSRRGIAHRDVSPSNVMVSRSGEVYLTDFGIARAFGHQALTDPGVVRGKIPYMAPEYALERRFDARSDLFSLGVVLYEALAGQRPYDGADDVETVRRIRDGHRPPLAALRPDAGTELVAIVERLLAPNAFARFPSAASVHEALALLAPPPSVARSLGELVRSLPSGSRDVPGDVDASGTASLSNVSAAPSLPEVTPADPDARTRTGDFASAGAGWASTDPSLVSAFDRPSPHVLDVELPALVLPDGTVPPESVGFAPSSAPGAAPEERAPVGLEPGDRRSGPRWVVYAAVGLVGFALATAVALLVALVLSLFVA